MNIELLYTSAPQGLKQGSRGFCTVISTTGLPINLAQKLESLSGYRHLYQPSDARADADPVCHSHLRFNVGGRTVSVISRVAAYGVDYSQRTNKIAHHISIDDPLPKCGPAAVLSQPGFMRTEWDSQCKTLSDGPAVPNIALSPSVCVAWQRMTGDAGWAGVIANAWMQPPGKPVWIVFSESQSSGLLSLMKEATALLPENRRWQATFSTYCTNLPPDVDCRVRCVVSGSDEARMAIARGLVVDLTKPMPFAVDSPATQAARTGHAIGGETARLPTPSTEPLTTPGKDIDSEEEYKVGGASLEQEYQVNGLSSIPPALFLPPQSRKQNRQGKFATVNETRQPVDRKWKRTALIASAVTALLLGLSGGGFYLVWQSRQLSKIVRSQKEVEPNEPNLQSDERRSEDNETPRETQKPPAPPTTNAPSDGSSLKEEIKIRFERHAIKTWLENKLVPQNERVAVVDVVGKPDAVVEMVDGDQWFTFDKDTKIIYLKENKSYDHETTEILEAVFSCDGKTEAIQVNVTNVNEPTLTLNILGDDNKPLEFAFVGQSVRVARTGYLNESPQASGPLFQWQGQTAKGSWENIVDATSESYSIAADFKFGKLKCNASDKDVSDTVASNEIAICPIGEVTIEIAELLRVAVDDKTPSPRMKLRIAFPEFASIKSGMMRRYDFAGEKGSIVDGQPNILEFDFEFLKDNVGFQYKFPEKLFRRPANGQTLETAESSISNLIAASRANTDATNKFKESIRLIEAGGDAIIDLKKFFHDLNLPEDADDLNEVAVFMNEVEKLRQLQLLYRSILAGRVDVHMHEFMGDIKKQAELFRDSKDQDSEKKLIKDKLDELTKHFSTFEKAFPDALKAKLKNRPSLNPNPLQEIKLLGSGLYNSQNKAPMLSRLFFDLIRTTNDLVGAIDSTNKLVLTLDGKSNINVWDEVKNSDGFASRNATRVNPISIPVRFKLEVIPVKATRVAKRPANGVGSSNALPELDNTNLSPKTLSSGKPQ